jgi:hypothetical protein
MIWLQKTLSWAFYIEAATSHATILLKSTNGIRWLLGRLDCEKQGTYRKPLL